VAAVSANDQSMLKTLTRAAPYGADRAPMLSRRGG